MKLRMCVFGYSLARYISIILCIISQHHIIHHITSMKSMENGADLRAMLYKNRKDTKAQSKLRITASSVLIRKKRSIIHEVLMFYKVWMIFTRHKSFSLQSMKRREGVFSPKAQKRYVHKSFMRRKELNYK
jgi:PHP family Zn ribbon phosphoesterase